MKTTVILSGFLLALAFGGLSAHAACGGGGFRPSSDSEQPQETHIDNKRQQEKISKLESLQRSIDKAQAKFDKCEGDCDKERRKLEEAKAKYARKAEEL